MLRSTRDVLASCSSSTHDCVDASSYIEKAMTEDLVEKARMAEHAERYEDMAKV